VYNNIFSNEGGRRYWGMMIGGGVNHIDNNIFYENNYGIRMEGGRNTVNNSIFFGTGANTWTYIKQITGSYSGDYNLFFGASSGWTWNNGSDIATMGTWRIASSQDAHSLNSDALFTNPGLADFTLKSGSPAIGAGVYIAGVSTANPPNIGAK
jgi:parallel beta-helix repeat protein